MEGKILGNRYELIEKIGGGGMAVVYKAKCSLLNRYVAVKILRPEFTNDEEFVKRFRVEAQAAASLSHPNIVSIYDVGQEDNIHYIVMEYIDGVTLKEYIGQQGPLDWREAVNIAIQICSAIEHAHRNHIVHRDIKPHNILLTKAGIAKVTDFGIARAVSSSTITMAGSTIGSVHYFSPEQARGGYTDEKSDLYSLGIALYEMVTGKVPFDGETPVAIALKHIQTEPLQPVEVLPGIPSAVNDIILRAIKKETVKRYQSASEMLQDLYRVRKEPEGNFVNFDVEDNFTTRRYAPITDADVVSGGGRNPREPDAPKEKKKDRLTLILAISIAVVIVGVLGYLGFRLVLPSIEPATFVLENYVGRNIDEVRAELKTKGITVVETPKFHDTYEKNIIISQNKKEGQTIKIGGYTTLELDVSKGPELLKIPDLRTREYLDAKATLNEMGIESTIVDEFSETVGEGIITRTDPPANEEFKKGTKVTLYRSKGPEIRATVVPNLIGDTMEKARAKLEAAKLKIGKISPSGDDNFTNKIIKQDPPANATRNEGTAVDLTFETKVVEQRVLKNYKLELDNPDSYGDEIHLFVQVTPSDTNKTETFADAKLNKATDFPINLGIPVPTTGKTQVRVFLDDKVYKEFEQLP